MERPPRATSIPKAAHDTPTGAQITTVLFDLDDTLFDHTGALSSGIRTLRTEEEGLLLTRSAEEIIERYAHLVDTIRPGSSPELRSHAEARPYRFQQLHRWLGGSGDPAIAERWSSCYRASYIAAWRPVPGAPQLVERIRRRGRIGIVTSVEASEQSEKLRVLGLDRYVDVLVTPEMGFDKPDPAMFAWALRELESTPDRSVMVGDSWKNDVLGARGAGISAVWFRRRGNRPNGFPEVRELDSFEPLTAAESTILDWSRRA